MQAVPDRLTENQDQPVSAKQQPAGVRKVCCWFRYEAMLRMDRRVNARRQKINCGIGRRLRSAPQALQPGHGELQALRDTGCALHEKLNRFGAR